MFTRILFILLLPCCAALPLRAMAAAEVAVSIAPLHSLVAAVMEGVARPELLVPAGASHHAYVLRPSDVRRLHAADLVIWIGEPLERFLVKPLATLDASTAIMAVARLPGIKLFSTRRGGDWRHANREAHRSAHGHSVDPHLWLSTDNARVIVQAVAARLAELDSTNAERYRANAEAMLARLTELDAELSRRLAPIKDAPYVVFHDAYRYFEERYGLLPVGSITTDPDQSPGARRIVEVRDLIEETQVRCVFGEPQFQPSLVRTVLEDTDARRGVLDPIGANIPPGPELYFTLMNRLADSLTECLM
jgi:zinc transport system substrate-binding protein